MRLSPGQAHQPLGESSLAARDGEQRVNVRLVVEAVRRNTGRPGRHAHRLPEDAVERLGTFRDRRDGARFAGAPLPLMEATSAHNTRDLNGGIRQVRGDGLRRIVASLPQRVRAAGKSGARLARNAATPSAYSALVHERW